MISSSELVMRLDNEFFNATPELLAQGEELQITSEIMDLDLQLFKQKLKFCTKLKKLNFSGFLSEETDETRPQSSPQLFLQILLTIQEVNPKAIVELDLSDNMLHERNLEFFINLKTILTLWTNILKINLNINSIFSIMGRRFTTDDQWHNKSEAIFAMLENYPRLLELDLSQELIEGRIPDCEWIDGNIIETLDRISRLCPNLQTLAMRNCPFKYLGFPYDDEYEPNSHPATISENEIQRFGEVLKQWQNLCQLDLRGCNLEIENTLLERLAYALATHPSLSIILIDDCFTTRKKELFFKQRIKQQREQLLVNLRATAKTLLFTNCLPRLTQFSPIKILEGNQYLMVDILEYADTLKQDREIPYLAVTPHIRFS